MAIERTLYFNLIYLATLMIAITLPYSIRISNYAIVFFGVIWFAGLGSYVTPKNRNFRLFLVFSLLYVIYLIGHIYSEHTKESLKVLETKIPLLILPLFFYSLPPLSPNKIWKILFAFVFSCLTLCTYCLLFILFKGKVLVNGFSSFNPWDFIHHNFTSPIGIHPLYLATYLNFSIVVLFWYITNGQKKTKNTKLWIVSIAILLMLFNLLILSRMGLVVMGLTASVLLVKLIRQGRFKRYYLAIALFMAAFTISLYAFNSTFKQRIDVLFSSEHVEGSFNQRQHIWLSSFSLFKKNALFGVGTGDARSELTNEFLINEYSGPYYNCHNEYLQAGISVGIFGVVILLANLLIPIILRWKNFLYILFLSILALTFLTESMLSVQKGVVFYSFFNSLFAFWGGNFEVRNQNQDRNELQEQILP
jgi:O-antigen ligase